MKKIIALALVAVMAMVCATTALAVDKTDAISGDLTVGGFFSEKTGAVELKSGDSYTIKFNNKSTGTNNWDNFVFAIVGEIGDAYTGGEQEIAIIRADVWAWGGGYSDLQDPNGADNPIAFEHDINWDEFVAKMQAGVNVEITISRDGNKLTYDAKIGDWTAKSTMTSGKALPESVYAFLTGENCVLSGISTTNNNAAAGDPAETPDDSGKEPDKTPETEVPDTGDDWTSIAVWLTVLAVSGMGVIATTVYTVSSKKSTSK